MKAKTKRTDQPVLDNLELAHLAATLFPSDRQYMEPPADSRGWEPYVESARALWKAVCGEDDSDRGSELVESQLDHRSILVGFRENHPFLKEIMPRVKTYADRKKRYDMFIAECDENALRQAYSEKRRKLKPRNISGERPPYWDLAVKEMFASWDPQRAKRVRSETGRKNKKNALDRKKAAAKKKGMRKE